MDFSFLDPTVERHSRTHPARIGLPVGKLARPVFFAGGRGNRETRSLYPIPLIYVGERPMNRTNGPHLV